MRNIKTWKVSKYSAMAGEKFVEGKMHVSIMLVVG
jgi:hypothetical protein